MTIDNHQESKPPVPNVTKPKDIQLSKPEHKKISEKITDLRDKISKIFNRREINNQEPKETFEELSSLTIPEDKTEKIIPPPILDTTQQNQEEINKLTKDIKNLQPEPVKAPEPIKPPERTLFPDRPSLYDQHHQKYDNELKTLEGKINRLKDIFELKKAGVKKAAHTYDGLRSRGIPRDQIIGNHNDVESPPSTNKIFNRIMSSQIRFFNILPSAIDRLYSLDQFNLDSFSSNENLRLLTIRAQIIHRLTDKQFNKIKNQLNHYSFLSNFYIIQFFNRKKLSPDTLNALSYLKKEYFSDPQNETKLNLFLKKNSSIDHMFTGIIHYKKHKEGISELIENLAKSDINDGQKINIPKELRRFSTKNETSFLNFFSELKNRDEQKFLIEESFDLNHSLDFENFIKRYFDNDLQPNFKFYCDFISSTEPSNTPVKIPNRILESIKDQYSKKFFEIISNLPERQFQHFLLNQKNEAYQFKYFNNQGQLNFSFYEGLLTCPDINIKPILIEHLPGLPENDQKNINLISRITSQSSINENFKIRNFLSKRYQDINLFFNPESSKPTSFLFESLVRNLSFPDLTDSGFLRSNLTDEVISNFSPEDQTLWKRIKELKNIDHSILIKIISNKSPDNPYFNENNQPTSFFFESLIKNKNINLDLTDSGFLRSNLTDEVISNFSPEDKKFWKFLLEKNLSLEYKKKIISNITFKLIINNREQLAKDSGDIDFLNNIIGMFGKKNESIINGYLESLTSGKITKKDKQLVLEFLKEFSILTPNIIKCYKESKQNHTEKLFISNLKEISQKLTSSKSISNDESQSPYYQELIKHVYPHNSGSWTSYESNNSCSDRSSDLSQFNIKDVYQIDLLSQSNIKIKEGEQIDINIQDRLEKQILQVFKNLQKINFDKEVGNQQLHQQADELLSQINLPNIDLSKLSIEDKLFVITSESIYHHQKINPNDIKNLLITYEFVNFEDIQNFIQGTNDKVNQAKNKTYAHLCELNNFYSDRIKEVNKRIIESVSVNPQVSKLFPSYFQSLSQENTQQSTHGSINKLQLDKLGLSNGFIDQITKTLQQRSPDKKYSPDQIKRMLHMYETITQGLTESKSNSPKKITQAFYGQFKSQRDKTFKFLNQLGSDYIDPRSIHLDEINLQNAEDLYQSIESGNYNQEEFLAYTAQKFIDIFTNERQELDTELSKYISTNNNERKILNAYITKTKSSANARMVGGVCVSGDNPSKSKKTNMWDMPNYFQMVFQDPKTSQCLGLCLLHHFKENGKKILTVSFNPSSTYLYSIDEASLFNGIYSQLKDFANQNGFDMITTSQNTTIRTNRTGGLFEQTINKKISQINKTFSFSEGKQFSYSPNYKIKDMDVIWEK